MDQLVAELRQHWDELSKKLTNLRKDSKSRKTENYLNTKSKEVEEIWGKVKSKDIRLQQLDEKKEHNYFKEKQLDHIEQTYKKLMAYINECRNSQDESEDNEFGWELNQQARRLQVLSEDIESAKVITDGYGQYLHDIKKQWEEITKADVELNKDPMKGREFKYFKEEWFSKCRKRYREIAVYLDTKIREQQESRRVSGSSNVILPKIKIPFFDGKYEEWPTFQDIFTKVIHDNDNVSKVEKIQYLKTYVKGEASQAIQHFEITENNYESAWQELKDRYDNKRRIVNKLINKMLQLPTISHESAVQLKTMYNTIKECLEAIRMQQINITAWDPIMICVIANKWDSKTNEVYESSLDNSFEVQTLDSVLRFLMKRFQSMEAASESKWHSAKGHTKLEPDVQHSKSLCKYCKSNHSIYSCPEFKSLNSNARFEFVKEKRLCFNCLMHEFDKKCFSQSKCRTCGKNHHTLIHRDDSKTSHNGKQTKSVGERPKYYEKSAKVTSNVAFHDETVLLATALIRVKNASNDFEYLRALIDPGSQAAFVTEETASLLGLPRQKITAKISGIGDSNPKTCSQKITVHCKPRISSTFNLPAELLILPKLTRNTPERQIQYTETEWQNVVIADPTFCKPGPIDIILGAREYREILLDGIKKTDNGLLGQSTELGWIIFGTTPTVQKKEIKVLNIMTRAQEEQDQITRFWEIEEVSSERQLSKEEEDCERTYEETTKRDEEGRYTVKIPFKNDDIELGESRPRAMARQLQLEKRLRKQENLQLRQEYNGFMQSYVDLGHMTLVPSTEEGQGKYYIPHQPVIREDSTTTKLRVVFDASCKTTNGKSLNEIMRVGPRIQQDLFNILIKWRSYKIAFSADIEKMYRQIKIDNEDQEFQRILWRFSENEPIKEYRLATVTYGTSSAPYLAIKTIQQLASDEKYRYPHAAKIARENCYVDDVLAGADTVKEALILQRDLINMFNSGGFNLRKWCSNEKELVENLPVDMRDKPMMEFAKDDVKKSLGVYWSPIEDTIRFKVKVTENDKLTKRIILSNVAKLFDPLGLLSPIVITAKLLVQELWASNMSWDEPVPKSINDKWNRFSSQLKEVEQISVPRWTNQATKTNNIELHGFCDASEKAFGAVVYVKTKEADRTTDITLVAAKSKVAPLKRKTTLPRLELCAAVLLAKLLRRIIEALGLTDVTVHAWSDSMITLSWITGDASRWKTFVANRVSEIQQLIGKTQWHHVGTKDNPADAISRGLEPVKIREDSLWWKGPKWLSENEEKWPKTRQIEPTKSEEKKCLHVNVKEKREKTHERFSSLTKLRRVLAYCLRFIQNCKKMKITGPLSVRELNEALTRSIVSEQQDTFAEEIGRLTKSKHIRKQSKLANLNPFLDKDTVLRVGGRLKHSLLKYDEKHPIIIAGNSHLSILIARDAHLQTLHGGNQQTLAYTRRKYWITNGKKLVKKIVNKCVTCVRHKARTAEQLMGQLPATRVVPTPAFMNTGIDYAGPIQIRTTKGRGHKSYKGYVAVFVCLATKAIHLEAVSDMTSETFRAALTRFTARRGTCANIYSDNGTNFVGASKTLEKEVLQMITESNVQDQLANRGVQWHFIPPSAPHFGGMWEAGVKSTKHHLKRVIGEATLTFEELTTLLCQIEACLNSRPLCTITDEVNDVAVLTPGHFLIGRELLTPANPTMSYNSMDLSGRWKTIQKMKRDFWEVWTTEYLHQLQQRNKWKTETKNLQKGDVVLIKEDNISASKWPLAKITEIYNDGDKLVRVVKLKRAGGAEIKRPIHKLIPLPTENESEKTEVKRKTNLKPPKSTWRIITIAILFLLQLGKGVAEKQYHIEYPGPGFYIEHLGQAKIDRGLFRVEIKFEDEKLESDIESVNKVINQVTDLCRRERELATDIECLYLVEHLKQEEKRIQWIKKGIKRIGIRRYKRGLMGNILTSVFGVNDEVYREIDKLNENQQELIQASNHQTKLMIKAITKVNETEVRVVQKLQHFQKKLNKALEAVDGMQMWYRSVDKNRLEIHALSVYEVAKNYIDELLRHYENLLKICIGKGNLYEIISPAQIQEKVSENSRKLPQNIEIVPHPIITTQVINKDNETYVYGYFSIAEITEYNLIKANPVPQKIENGTYWILDAGIGILAVDYNNQRYFEISDTELKSSLVLQKHIYICSPSIIRNMENNPNCVIDELYQRNETTCPYIQNKITATIWKRLYTSNTWMFITPQRTKIAITCNGRREEATVQQTGIIAISQNCVISTKKTILTPKRIQTVPVLAGYMRPVSANLTVSKEPLASSRPKVLEEYEIEPYEDFTDIRSDEGTLQTELLDYHWHSITHHSTITSGITTITIVSTIIVVICGVQKCFARDVKIGTRIEKRVILNERKHITRIGKKPVQASK